MTLIALGVRHHDNGWERSFGWLCSAEALPSAPEEPKALRSSARSLAQGVSPGNTRTKTASPGRATERRRISAARSGLQDAVTINLALTRQAKILLPLRGSRMSKLESAPEEPNVYSNKPELIRAPEGRHQGMKADVAPPEPKKCPKYG
jgi:hypothetical protein